MVVWYVQDGIKSYFYAKSANIPSAVAPKILKLTVAEPEDGLATASSTIKISGTITIPAKVIFTGGASDLVIDSNGTFNADYELAEGENDISVVALSSAGETAQETRSILYVKDLE